MEPVRATVDYTVDDYVRGLLFVQSRSWLNRYLPFIVGGGAFLLFSLATLMKAGPARSLSYYVFAIAFPAIVIVTALTISRKVFHPWRLRRFFAKQFKESPSLRETSEIEINDYGIEGTTFLGSSSTSWTALIGAVETDTDFHFLIGPKRSIFIPKAALEDPDDVRKMRLLIEEKLGTRARLN